MSQSVQSARRRLAYLRVSLGFFAIIALTGCRVDSVITLDIGQTGSGVLTVSMTADKDVVDQTPSLISSFRFEDAIAAGWVVSGPNVTADGGIQISISHAFSDLDQASQLFTQLGSASGPFKQISISRKGSINNSTYKLDGVLQVDGGLAAFSDDQLLKVLGVEPFAQNLQLANLDLASAMKIDFVAKLPGKTQQTTGLATENTVTWQVPLDGSALSVTYTSKNTALKAIAAQFTSLLFKFLLVLWIVGMAIKIVTIAYKRRSELRTPTE